MRNAAPQDITRRRSSLHLNILLVEYSVIVSVQLDVLPIAQRVNICIIELHFRDPTLVCVRIMFLTSRFGCG